MPITNLYVEGRLDLQIVNALITEDGQSFAIEEVGSKDLLAKRVEKERATSGENCAYFLRDRDFDFDVEVGARIPKEIHHNDDGTLIGWHWCRHELENYLLEPALFSHVFEQTTEDVENALRKAALRIRNYQAARWTIGNAKRLGMLPPKHVLHTKFGKKDFSAPLDWNREQCLTWAIEEASNYLNRVENLLSPDSVTEQFSQFENKFTVSQCENITWILYTFSGKDLFCALQPWFQSIGLGFSGDVRDRMRKWITETNPQYALDTIPEWCALLDIYKGL